MQSKTAHALNSEATVIGAATQLPDGQAKRSCQRKSGLGSLREPHHVTYAVQPKLHHSRTHLGRNTTRSAQDSSGLAVFTSIIESHISPHDQNRAFLSRRPLPTDPNDDNHYPTQVSFNNTRT